MCTWRATKPDPSRTVQRAITTIESAFSNGLNTMEIGRHIAFYRWETCQILFLPIDIYMAAPGWPSRRNCKECKMLKNLQHILLYSTHFLRILHILHVFARFARILQILHGFACLTLFAVAPTCGRPCWTWVIKNWSEAFEEIEQNGLQWKCMFRVFVAGVCGDGHDLVRQSKHAAIDVM